jgi:hypothetical protein
MADHLELKVILCYLKDAIALSYLLQVVQQLEQLILRVTYEVKCFSSERSRETARDHLRTWIE